MNNINVSCPINSTGYGIVSKNILKSIYNTFSKNISLFPIGSSYVEDQKEYDFFSELVVNSVNNLDIDAPFVKIWHQFDLIQKIGRGKYFAFPFFELDTFNDLEKKHMTVPDALFVTSQWAKNIIEKNNIDTETFVCPLGVDLNIFNAELNQKYQYKNKFVFLNIGKWEIRKGHDILLNIFRDAFPDNEDVELWILASENTNSYSSKEELEKWKNIYSHNNIKLFNGVDTHFQIAELIAQADCGIFPSRAEGWNLELLECMAMNKPVIATNFSAHTEFCNSQNSYLIDIDTTEPAFDGKAFKGQGHWAKISQKQIDQAIGYMRHVYQNGIKTNINGINTAKKYSWDNTAKTIQRCIGL
jgi:hypothetical protein